MKGIVFTNFLKMVEELYGLDCVDTIIEKAKLPSGGSYTAVGTYPHQEMASLVIALHQESNIPVDQLLKIYGKYLFSKLASNYPEMIKNFHSSFELLKQLDSVIHVEVAKLYPDAELPSFKATQINANTLEMIYASDRHMEDLAEGLLIGCFEHFEQKNVTIQRVNQKDFSVKFIIKLNE